jgi:hypothetical protein
MSEENTKQLTNLSMKTIAATFGVSMKTLKAAKELGGDGFNTNNSVNWLKLEPWIKEHGDEIEALQNNSIEGVTLANKIKDGILKDLEIAKIKGKLVERENVHALLKRISTAQSSLLNAKFIKELLPKMKGKELPEMIVMTNELIAEVISIIQTMPIDKWNQGN